MQEKTTIFYLLINLLKGRLQFKSYIYSHCDYSLFASYFPVNISLLEYLKQEKMLGSKVVLVSASLEESVKKIVREIGLSSLFDEIHGSSEDMNLKGVNKLKFITTVYKDKYIVYCGDSKSDIKIWNSDEIDEAVITGRNTKYLFNCLSKTKERKVKVIETPKPTIKDYLRALRVHQWSKNCLIFVPLLCSFSFLNFYHDLSSFWAFISFSLGASATYILNDLWDLPSDRIHSTKCKRPFASGLISVGQGIILSLILLFIAVFISMLISVNFLLLQIFYLMFTTLYSVVLKKIVLVDIVTLAILYVTRILAGNVVSNIDLSYWLLSFAFMVFLSLGTLKRYVELKKKSEITANTDSSSLSNDDEISFNKHHHLTVSGRGYVKDDLYLLMTLGTSSYIGAIVLFGLYITSSEMVKSYSTPEVLWLVQMIFFYLIGNMWFVANRGKMLDDPVLFFIKDKISLLCMLVITTLASIAYYL